MSHEIVFKQRGRMFKTLAISGLGLALCFGAQTAFAQDNQPGQPGQPGQVTMQQQGPPSQGPANQGYQGYQGQGPQDQGPPPNQAAPPQSFTLPAGTVLRVRTNEWISTDRNVPGDSFSAVLDQPIVADGWVVGRRGQAETGRVSMAIKAGHGNSNSQLGVQLSELTLLDGQRLPVQTELVQSSAGSSNGRNAAVIGTTTGIGAVIGAAADGGPGAAIGAVVGGAAGIAGVMSTRGKPTVIAPESVLSFRLQAPVTISTEKSQYAFQPVTQSDYDSRPAYGRRQNYAPPGSSEYAAPAPPPNPYYGYPYGYYPVPFGLGFYGGYGFGGRFGGFGGFRGGFRR